MAKFTIDYNTGITDEVEVTDLAEAKKIAEEGMAYTGQNVIIKDENGEAVTESRWWPHAPNPDEDFVLVQIGNEGFYEVWSDELGDF